MVKVRELMIPMEDGARLFTRVVLPGDGKGTYPTVFMRTPYENETTATAELIEKYENNAFIRRGYAVVLQHCRGRGGSEGVCIPYSYKERSDGLATLDAVRKMPHYNGQIFLRGGSYTASVLLMMLGDNIPDLAGLAISVQTESMYHRNYYNGLCRSWCGFTWWLSMISEHQPKIGRDEDIFIRPYIDMMRRATGKDLPDFTEELLHDRFDGFWKNDPRIGVIEKISVPVLFTSGWYDYYCYGMCSMWEKLSPETRAKSLFLMTPWGHGQKERNDPDFPMPCGALPSDKDAAWFDHIRGAAPFPYGKEGDFRYYSIGEDVWKNAKSPYENEPSRAFFLSADGMLVSKSPRGKELSYRYDPDRPFHHDRHDDMFLCDLPGTHADVLSFVSEPFAEDAAFFGPVLFRLKVCSDRADTAFCMRLYYTEEGRSYNIVDAATTLLHANPNAKPDRPSVIEIISQPTAFKVKKGAGIRVDISSWSDCYAPHPNTKRPLALARRAFTAKNTVFCGQSAVFLPESKA